MTILRILTITLLLMTHAAMADDHDADNHDDERYLKFTMTYEGTPSTGEFTDFVAKAAMDPDNLDAACLDVKVNTLSADIGSKDLNTELPGPDWFAAEEYPRAHFFSDSIRLNPESEIYQYVAEGELSLKGNTEAVDLPFNWTQTDNTAVLSGQTEVSRLDFDIGSGEWADTDAIGDTVILAYSTRFRWKEGAEGAPCPVDVPDVDVPDDQSDDDVLEAAEPDVADLPDPVSG